jgi:D-arginine utilization repressor
MRPTGSRSRPPGAGAVPPDVAATASAIAALFHPHVEVALHDIAEDRVVAIWSNGSGRQPGDESLLDPQLLGDAPDGHVFGPYEQIDRRGRRLTSVSVRLQQGRLLLCLNFDRSPLVAAAALLSVLAAPREDPPDALFQRDWRAHINTVIDEWCRASGAARSALTRDQRQALVDELEARGVFDTRHAAAHVAAALDVSRATVYALRKQTRAAAGEKNPQGPVANSSDTARIRSGSGSRTIGAS